jgi:hypothetical protein
MQEKPHTAGVNKSEEPMGSAGDDQVRISVAELAGCTDPDRRQSQNPFLLMR